jgi:MraZ protein
VEESGTLWNKREIKWKEMVKNNTQQIITPVDTEKIGLGFASEFLHSLDEKKRVIIPAIWREIVGDPKSLYVLPGLNEPCLYIYPTKQWNARLTRLQQTSYSDPKVRMFLRVLASQSEVVSWDNQGRIRIKDGLLRQAKLISEVKLIGAWDRFELWSPDEWQKALASVDQATMEEGRRSANI